MMRFLRFMIGRHPVLAGILALALASTVYFAAQVGSEMLYFADPAHQQQDLALWMSPRYVGKSWDLPPETIRQVMDLQPDNAQKTLKDVTAHLGISLEELQDRIKKARTLQDAMRMFRGHHD